MKWLLFCRLDFQMYENLHILIQTSLKFVANNPIFCYNKLVLVQTMVVNSPQAII